MEPTNDPSPLILTVIFILALAVGVGAVFRRGLGRCGRDGGCVSDPVGPFRSWDLVMVCLLFLVFALPIWVLWSGRTDVGGPISSADVQAGIMQQLALAGMVIGLVSMRGEGLEWLGWRWHGWRVGLWLAPACVVAMWVFLLLLKVAGYADWLRALGTDEQQDAVQILGKSTDFGLVAWLCVAAIGVAPVCEEVLFRGYCYPVLRRYSGSGAAACVTSMVFACVHAHLGSLLPLFVLGLLLVFVRQHCGSIWAPIMVHGCFNAATVVVHLGARWLGIPMEEMR